MFTVITTDDGRLLITAEKAVRAVVSAAKKNGVEIDNVYEAVESAEEYPMAYILIEPKLPKVK